MAIQQKPKICKGINNAKGFGCGELSDKRTFGLCPVCKYQWATTTEKGKVWFETQMAFKKKMLKKRIKKVEILNLNLNLIICLPINIDQHIYSQ